MVDGVQMVGEALGRQWERTEWGFVHWRAGPPQGICFQQVPGQAGAAGPGPHVANWVKIQQRVKSVDLGMQPESIQGKLRQQEVGRRD